MASDTSDSSSGPDSFASGERVDRGHTSAAGARTADMAADPPPPPPPPLPSCAAMVVPARQRAAEFCQLMCRAGSQALQLRA